MADTIAARAAAYDPDKTYVVAGDWCVSGVSDGDGGYTLKVYRVDNEAPNDMGGTGVIYRHPEHDGLHFPTWNAAQCHAYTHGFLTDYVPRPRPQ